MLFRTEISVQPQQPAISYQSPILMLGSCFANNIGAKLQNLKLPVVVNPFGVLYNPVSIANNLARLLAQKPYEEAELYQFKDLWLSFAHHGSFSQHDKTACLANINQQYVQAIDALAKAKFLFITFGTTFIYKRRDTQQVVANCHQLPTSFFERENKQIEQIKDIWLPLLAQLLAKNPQLQLIFTLSPIRHWKDGAIDNHLSKATLRVAIHELTQHFSTQTAYFPAYELLIDDLRDYRFYERDMLHPNTMAIDYIWQKFKMQYLHGNETSELMTRITAITEAYQHRPRYPHSESHRQFVQNMITQIDKINQQYPNIDLEKEKKYFQIQ